MTTFDPRGEQGFVAAVQARLVQDRASELARGAELARELRAALDPNGAGAVSRLATVLTKADSLTPEGRGAFLAAFRPSPTSVVSEADAAALVRRRLEALYPAASEARGALGMAIARLRGRGLGAAEAQALAGELIARATTVGETLAAKSASGRGDTIEAARPASQFQTVLRGPAPPVDDRAGTTSPPRLQTSPPPLPAQVSLSGKAVLSAGRVCDSLPVTTPGLQSVARRFSIMQASLLRGRQALAGEARESPAVRYWLRAVTRNVKAIEAHVQAAEARLAREVAVARPTTSVLAGIAGAQGELRAVSPPAAEAREALVEVVGKTAHADVRTAIRELDVVARESARAEADLGLVEGRVRVLADGAARPAVLAPATPAPTASAPTASAPTASVPEGSSAAGGLNEEDLRSLGTALGSSQPPPQILWTEAAVNAAWERGRAQGGVSDAESQAHLELAGRLLQGAAGPAALGAADLAAALKQAGLPLEKVDPQQLEAAARYASAATSGSDQQDRLRKAIDGFQVLARAGAPRLSREDMVNELWAAARVPGHALQKLSDAEVAKVLQQVTAAVNGGPGEHELKVGSHKLKFTVGTSGEVASSSCKKQGLLSKIGGALKKIAPIALTVLSFTPVAPFAIAANAALGAYKAIKAKSLLGLATAAASMVGAGAAIVASKALGAAAAMAARVSNVATGVSRTLQGVSSLKQGNLLGGLAAIGSGVAGGIGAFAKTAGDGLSNAAAKLDEASRKLALAGRGVSAIDGYRAANRAVSDAKAALRRAEASGDRSAIAAARQRLQQAESAKTSAVLGTVASAASLAADARATYSRQPGEPVDTPPTKLSLDVALRTAWRGLEVARGIHDHDLAAAGANALGLAAVARQATGAEPSKGLGLTDAANMADAALGYHQASRAEGAADTAVAEAERQLRAARLGGNAEAIRQAEASLRQARKAREGALMGGMAAGETLLRTAEEIGQKRHELGQVETSRQLASHRGEQLLSLIQDPRATTEQKQEALAALVRLAQAGTTYEQALASGNVVAMRMARVELEAVNERLRTRPPGGVPVASLGVRDVQPSLPSSASGSGGPETGQGTGAYRVADGDTLWRLAKNYGIKVEDLLRVNPGLDPEGRIRVGEVIRIPMPERSGAVSVADGVITIEIPPPQGTGATSTQAPSTGTGAGSAEGWGPFWEGVIQGDFGDNDSWSKTGGQVVIGLVPWAGQAADARDTIAALDHVRAGRPGAWLGLLAAAVAWLPGAGDALKGAVRGGKKVAGEVAEEALEAYR